MDAGVRRPAGNLKSRDRCIKGLALVAVASSSCRLLPRNAIRLNASFRSSLPRMTLCFDEAYQALKAERITEQEYLHQVLAHFSGVRHPADEKARPWELKINDPVGNAIRDAALSSPSTRPEGKLCMHTRLGRAWLTIRSRHLSFGGAVRKHASGRCPCIPDVGPAARAGP